MEYEASGISTNMERPTSGSAERESQERVPGSSKGTDGDSNTIILEPFGIWRINRGGAEIPKGNFGGLETPKNETEMGDPEKVSRKIRNPRESLKGANTLDSNQEGLKLGKWFGRPRGSEK